MKEKIFINGFEEKFTRERKKYYSFDTSKGPMSLWDDKLFNQLHSAIASKKPIEVDFETKGRYTNILGLGTALDSFQPGNTFKKWSPENSVTREEREMNNKYTRATMVLSYVKDLVIADKVKIDEMGDKYFGMLNLVEEGVKGAVSEAQADEDSEEGYL